MKSKRSRRWAAALLVWFALVVNAAFAQTDQIVYDDALENGWVSYGWAAMLNYTNTSTVHSGTHSILVGCNGDYQAVYLHHNAFTTSAYTNLTFWINVGPNTGIPLYVQATVNGIAQSGVMLSSFTANTWQQFTLTWNSLNVANTVIDGFWIQAQINGVDTFYVDDIKLTAIPTPTTVHLNVNANQVVRTVDARLFGLNTATWDYNLNSAATITLLGQMGVKALRFPGGSTSDDYHWQPNTGGGTSTAGFANVVSNLGAQAFITANYGSGTAQEATAWVAYANVTNHYGFKYWEIGNENYGSWETDTNALKNDPYTYALHAQDYINGMKAVDTTIKIGVPVVTGEDSFATYTNHLATNTITHQVHHGWTPVLLSTLKNLGVTPDFLIYHRYDQNPGEENDASLLQSSATWTNDAADLRGQINGYLGAAGTNIELLCTENNSVSYDPGKQSTSLVNGLFLADSFGQIAQTEFNSRLWWDLRNSQIATNNNDPSLYGWRQYGDYGIINSVTNCYPNYYAGRLLQYFARGGDQIISAASDYPLLSVYAAKRTNGSLSLLVINKSSNVVLNGSINLTGFASATNAINFFYGVPQDNAAQTGIGSQDIAQTNFMVAGTNFSLNFPAYSATVLSLPPAPPRFSLESFPAGGHFQCQLTGQAGAGYAIEQSSDLLAWQSVSTNYLTNGTAILVDLQSTAQGQRFYRAVWLP
jgi:hypothetical protein